MENLNNLLKDTVINMEGQNIEVKYLPIKSMPEEIKSLFEKLYDAENDEELKELHDELVKYNLTFVQYKDEEDDAFMLIELPQQNNNENKNNKKENDTMENTAKIICADTEMLYDIKTNIIGKLEEEFEVKMPCEIEGNNIVLDMNKLNKMNDNIVALLGFELNYRKDKMEESYKGLNMNKLHYREKLTKSTCALFSATAKKKINFYRNELKGYDFIEFKAIKVKGEGEDKEVRPVIHFVVYNMEIGHKAELRRELKVKENIDKGADFIVNGIGTGAYTFRTIVDKAADVVDPLADAVVATEKFVVKTGTIVVNKLWGQSLECFNDVTEGNYISEKDKKKNKIEMERASKNWAKIKERFSKNDEDDEY